MYRLVSYAARHHVGLLALAVALGGTSYAAVNLPRNSVGSKQIDNREVRQVDLAKEAITSSRIRNSSLLMEDFMPGQLPAGLPGRDGQDGTNGRDGADGADGTALAFAHVNANATLDGGRSKGTNVTRARRGVNGADEGPAPGSYCFQLSFIPRNAVASPDSDGGGVANPVLVDLTPATAPAPSGDLTGNVYCPSGFQAAQVSTGHSPASGPDRAFYVVFN